MEYPSLAKCFLDAVDRYANPRAQLFRTPDKWESITAQEMLRRVAGLSNALAGLGVGAGDRIGIFAPNCPEWHMADFAVQALGAATVPIYCNDSPDRLAYVLNDSGARIVITSGDSEARRIAECRKRLPHVEHLIAVAPPVDLQTGFLDFAALVRKAGDAEIAEYRHHAAGVSAEQLATIIYTSGTTGEPRGVMLSHTNLSSNALDSLQNLDIYEADVALSFLPLAHVYERTASYGFFFRGVSVAYVRQVEMIAQALLEVHPTIAAGVPRFFEKVYANILERGHQEKGLRRKIFDWALRVAEKAVPWRAYSKDVSFGVKLGWHVADTLVYSKIRDGLGGRVRAFISGGAPLAPELAAFYWSLRVPVYEGYGLTETSPVVAVNLPMAHRIGTVGCPIPNVQVRIATDGEVLVKGPCIMQGYYNKPEDTRQVFTPDGWFCTGDIGQLDDKGYLIITDRKRDLLKTAAGKFVSPAPIENALKASPFIANVIVVGDRRKFVVALIVPDFAALEAATRQDGRKLLAPAQLIDDAWVRDLYAREVERLTRSLAQYERPKKFALLDEDFAFEKGELTYTLKMRRRVIEARYQEVIAGLYADVEEPRPHTAA
jgi:long-chain acyl-CoA synthetase